MNNLINIKLDLLMLLFLNACVNKQIVLKLDYQDFGPQAMSYELIGYDWWSWLDCHCEETADQYPVYVIVYVNMDKELLTINFPIDQQKGSDLSFVKYCDAMEYLQSQINEVNQTPTLNQITKNLTETKSQLLKHFTSQSCN